MACLLQPECNFLYAYFRCWLPVEVVDVEVKITSMQGTHIFGMDRITQLIKCTLWNTRLHPHPTIIKKMKTFLEVEWKMGSIPQPASQYRPPQPDTNPKVRKDNAVEKRKRAAPTKRFRPSTAPKPSETAVHWPATISKAPVNVKPQTDAPENRPPTIRKCPSSWKHSMAWCWKDVRKHLQGQKLVAPSQLLEQWQHKCNRHYQPKTLYKRRT